MVSACYQEAECEALRECHSLKHLFLYRTGIQGLRCGNLAKEGRKAIRRNLIRSWRTYGPKGRKRASEVPLSFEELPFAIHTNTPTHIHRHTHTPHLSLVHPQPPDYWESHTQILTTAKKLCAIFTYFFPMSLRSPTLPTLLLPLRKSFLPLSSFYLDHLHQVSSYSSF